RDSCTFQLGALAGIFDRILPEPEVMLRANHSCVGREKQFQSASMLYGKPYHYIDLPNHFVGTTEDYVTQQIEELFHKLERQFGPKATPSRIEEVFAHSNRMRENCLKLNELRKQRILPVDPRTMFFIIPVIAGYLEPSQQLADLTEKIYQEFATLGENAGPEEVCRLFLMLAPFLFPSQPFYDWLEKEMGVRFVFEEQSHIYWRALDPADPFRSLARKCLDMDWVGPLSRRMAAADRLVDAYQAHGVLFTSIWGCRHLIGGVQLVRKHFAQRGIPFLNLDVDLGDERSVDFASIQSRIEEFLEIIRRPL
ncbi:MAG: 2-hydroxyacyl-CoA dehydratase, partial [Candidatus Tectomicrobia bacterium]|nr:2-hydroxyacyl-CoA dehydratase [Candidatus Tectomicrobia bacterium]